MKTKRSLSRESKSRRRKPKHVLALPGRDSRGATSHPLYGIWIAMLARCHDPDHPAYEHYGGRGIRVCKRWRKFWNFATDMGPRPEQFKKRQWTLERTDNDSGYSKANCKWASWAEQARNRRSKGKDGTINGWTTRQVNKNRVLNVPPWMIDEMGLKPGQQVYMRLIGTVVVIDSNVFC